MKPFENFLSHSSGLREMLDIYLELRQHFQELGFSEEDLKSPPTYTQKMMSLFHKFDDTQKALFQQVKDYGFDINWNDFTGYTTKLLSKINELTPLKENGNNERRDQGDEDY
jgi:vacuolar-type H+-ATPase catalytic subunit A/Vma1